MCAVYIIFSLIWFTCSCCYFNEIIRIQFWIGAVIFLGLVEKAAYLAEYESVNKNGYTVEVGLICAEFISCLKRSLARMLVIIVSLGFGIVKYVSLSLFDRFLNFMFKTKIRTNITKSSRCWCFIFYISCN
jgi:hypothetical protein